MDAEKYFTISHQTLKRVARGLVFAVLLSIAAFDTFQAYQWRQWHVNTDTTWRVMVFDTQSRLSDIMPKYMAAVEATKKAEEAAKVKTTIPPPPPTSTTTIPTK